MNNKIDIQTGEYVRLYFQKASVARRVSATLIDWLMYFGIYYATWRIYVFLDVPWSWSNYFNYLFYFFISTIGLFTEYFSKGYTVGKLVTGIRLINDQCTPPTFMQCFVRWLLFCVDVWFVGVIMIGSKGQRIGDMAAGIQCIYVNEQGQKDVDLNKDFDYIKEDYTVRFPQVKDFKQETIKNIEYILYHNGSFNKADLCIKIRKYLNIRFAISDDNLLKQVYNDYKYMKLNNIN